MKCSVRFSTRSSSRSLPSCRFLLCSGWKAGCFIPWPGRWRSRWLGALLFSIVVAPVLASFAFAKGTSEWHNPVMTYVIARYRDALRWAIRRRAITVGASVVLVAIGNYLAFSGAIGSEFLPHLDEGALWVRGTLAPSTGPDEGIRVANQARIILCSFPEVPQCTSQVGRPDDGTDNTGFFNTEYFVDLKPREKWRPVFHQNKDELIAAMQRELDKIPGVIVGIFAAHRRQHGRGRERGERRAGYQDLWRRLESARGEER